MLGPFSLNNPIHSFDHPRYKSKSKALAKELKSLADEREQVTVQQHVCVSFIRINVMIARNAPVV